MTQNIEKSRRLLTATELADRWQMAAQTLWVWRSQGKGPAFVRLGDGAGAIRYRIEDIEAYEDRNRQPQTERKADES